MNRSSERKLFILSKENPSTQEPKARRELDLRRIAYIVRMLGIPLRVE